MLLFVVVDNLIRHQTLGVTIIGMTIDICKASVVLVILYPVCTEEECVL